MILFMIGIALGWWFKNGIKIKGTEKSVVSTKPAKIKTIQEFMNSPLVDPKIKELFNKGIYKEKILERILKTSSIKSASLKKMCSEKNPNICWEVVEFGIIHKESKQKEV